MRSADATGTGWIVRAGGCRSMSVTKIRGRQVRGARRDFGTAQFSDSLNGWRCSTCTQRREHMRQSCIVGMPPCVYNAGQMPPRYQKIASLLALVQDVARRQKTNPYQIAKATGLPLRSIQKLLTQSANPTLRNVEVILDGFGMSIHVVSDGPVSIKPGKSATRDPKRVAS